LIELALQSRNGNQVKTAQLLGINRNTLEEENRQLQNPHQALFAKRPIVSTSVEQPAA
jgi:DNA-binding NtrC family response regulator